MKSYCSFLGAIFIGFAMLPQPAHADVELFICHEDTYGGANWQLSSVIQIAQILKEGADEFSVNVSRAVCNNTMPDTVCAATPGRMFCRQTALRRMNLVASWYAYKFINGQFESYEDFQLAHDKPSGQAFRYADGSNALALATDVQEEMRIAAEAFATVDETIQIEPDMRRMAEIQRRIMFFNYAALVGHEAHHMNNESCPILQKSQMETSGIFDHLLELQTSDGLFCEANPNPYEISADRCAARYLERSRSRSTDGIIDDQNMEYFAQRAASDMIAFQSLTGFRRFVGLPQGSYGIPEFDAYLNPVFRLTLLAGSISSRSDQPPLCGDAASLFVHGVQTSYQQCPGDGQVSDALLALLPSGVEDSWNGAPWSASSFSCIR
jgi:hypothetical protein